MFNRNGSNNGHNGNGTGNGLVQVNGTGHKPDAAIVSEHDPASSAGLALLWDGLSPAVTQALGQPLDPPLASQRKGRAGRSYDYLEGHVVIEQANRIFGFGGWGYELAGDVTLRRVETVDTQTGEVKVSLGYSAPVRVTVAGALPRTDLGVHPVAEDTLDGHDTAMKGAVTDGMKRAFRSFGVQFGNGFYGDQPQVGNSPQPQRVPAQTNGDSGQAQASRPTRQAQGGRSESQIEKLRKRLIEIAAEQGLDEDQVRTAVTDRTGKSLDERLAVSARYLSTHYGRMRCWAFPDPEREVFDQVVLMGYRKADPVPDATAESMVLEWAVGEPEPLRSQRNSYSYTEYSPATTPNGDILFTTRTVDPVAAAAEARRSGLWASTEITDSLWPASDSRTRPLMPLRRGHMAMLVAAGFLDNLVLEADDRRILVKGRTSKDMVLVEDAPEKEVHREKLTTTVVALDLGDGRIEDIAA